MAKTTQAKMSGFALLLILIISVMHIPTAQAQEKQLIQLKVLNVDLKPFGNVKISINGEGFIALADKGTAIIELQKDDLPIKTIETDNPELEAASWNLSKGFLEVIVRKKSYRKVTVVVKDAKNQTLNLVKVNFSGSKTITDTTDEEGKIQLPLALNEKIDSENQFKIEGYLSKSISFTNGDYLLSVEKIAPIIPKKELISENTKDSENQGYFRDFDISRLDSIQSLTVFYAIFKNYEIEKLSENTKRKVDAKFEQLVGELKDSLKRNVVTIMSNISDSTYVQDDIKNLKKQARIESDILKLHKQEFEEKIKLVNEKLAQGFDQMNKEARAALLSDINQLEKLLISNESEFYKNQKSYQRIISSLKDRFFDIEQLEGQLSESEAERLRERAEFQERMLIISAVVVLFVILSLLLVYFSWRLRKQKRALSKANVEVKHINENLEAIVYDRTKLLEETFRELDTVLYRASHDLRSPVCSIAGLCHIANITSTEPNEVIDRMLATNKDMDRLLKKLSIISEIHQPGNFSIVFVRELLAKIQQGFQQVIDEHDIHFELECPQELVINTIPNLLEVILSNLIENAIYYCLLKKSSSYHISLKVNASDKHLHILLQDNGVGVEMAIKNKLFDMFFRGNEYSQGNGLGLYIVHKSVQVLNGEIRVESEPGNFSRFEVQLPLQGAEEYSFSFLKRKQGDYSFYETSEQG